MNITAEELALLELEENDAAAMPAPVGQQQPEDDYEVATAAPVREAAPAQPTGDIPLERFINAEQLKKDVAINMNDLDNAMMQHASLYVYYAGQTVKARRQHDRLKNAFEILEARLDKFYRDQFATEGKKVTEGAIRQALVADERWSNAQGRVIEANSIFRMCEVAEDALVQRKDMILEIARDRRKEREGQMRVLELEEQKKAVAKSLRASA